MRYQRENMSLSMAGKDTPAPQGVVERGTNLVVHFSVYPVNPNWRGEVRFKRNEGSVECVPARWAWNDPGTNTMHFSARLPDFEKGDSVAYGVRCFTGPAIADPDRLGDLTARFQVGLPKTTVGGASSRMWRMEPSRRMKPMPGRMRSSELESRPETKRAESRRAISGAMVDAHDRVSEPSRSFAIDDDIQMTVTNKFMDNFVPVRPIDHHKSLVTACDAEGGVMLFAIGGDDNGDDQVMMFRKSQGSDNNWKITNLSRDLGSNYAALDLAVAHDPGGAPILAGVFQHKGDPDRRYFFNTRQFGDQPDDRRWVSRGSVNHSGIEHIATGFGFEQEVLIVVAVREGRDVSVFQIQAAPNQPTAPWTKLPFNVDSTGILAMGIGHLKRVQTKTDLKRKNNPAYPNYRGNAGTVLYTLTEQNADVIVYMKGLEDPSYNHTIHFEDRMSSMALGRNGAGYTECFLGSTRLYHLNAERQRLKLVNREWAVAGESFEEPIDRIAVNPIGSDRYELWALLRNGYLNYTSQVPAGGWLLPTALRKGVAEMATHRDAGSGALELYSVDPDNALFHLWRDPITTRWQTRQIDVPDTGRAKHHCAHTTQLRLVDQRNNPVADFKLKVHASELSVLDINGKHYFVGPHEDEGAEVMTNARGMVMLTNQIDATASPHFRIQCMDKVVEISPSADLKSDLQKQLDGGEDALLGAKMKQPDGSTKPLLRGKYATKAHARAAHQVLTRMLKVTKKEPSAMVASARMRVSGRVRHKFNNTVDASGMGAWSLDLRGGVPQFQDGAATAMSDAVMEASVSGSIVDAVGDFFQGVLDGIHRIEHLAVRAVEEGLELIVNGILRIVLEFAEQVWTVVDWFFKNVLGVDLGDLLKWLGFIFEWGDILKSQRELIRMFDNGIDRMIELIRAGRHKVDGFFTEIEKKLAGGDLTEKLGEHAEKPATEANGPESAIVNLLTGGNPAVDWIFSKISKLDLFKKIKGEFSPFDREADNIENILQRLVAEEFEDMSETVSAAVRYVLDNLTKVSLGEMLEHVLEILAAGVVEMTKDAVDAFLDVVIAILGKIKAAAHKPWHIPFISPLYKNFIDPGRDLSAISLSCLIMAVPATIVFKIVTGKAPVEDGGFPMPDWGILAGESETGFLARQRAGGNSGENEIDDLYLRGSFFFGGLAVGFGRIYTNILNGLLVWNGPSKEEEAFEWAVKSLSFQKIASTTLTFAASMTNLGFAFAVGKKKHGFEKGVAFAQIAFPAMAMLAYVNLLKSNKAKREESMVLGSALGGLNVILICVLFLVERETESEDTQDIDWKFAQNLLLGIAQFGAIYPLFAKTPRLKALGMAGFMLLGLGTGGINIGRAIRHYKMAELHNVI